MKTILCRRSFLVRTGLAAVALAVTSPSIWAAPAPQALPRSTPEAQGVASGGILDFVETVDKEHQNLHSVMIVRHGQVIAEGWWAPYAPNLRHTLYSLSKSFTSTAVGLAVAEGKLSVDDKVLSFFPDDAPAEVGPNLAAMQVKHLLMMGAGHDADSLFGGSFSVKEENWIRSVLARPVPHEPGTHFRYNNGATFLLSAIVTKVTGQTVHEYLKPRLFAPLGITGTDWEVNPQGINNGAWGLRVHTEDIAKLGQLYLQKGMWNGQRILPESWVEAATHAQISNASGNADKDAVSDWAQGYGYQFWRCRNNGFRGDGAFGQYCIVLPELDTVIAITSETNNMQAILNNLWEHVLPALKGEGLAGEKAEVREQLAKKLKSLRLPTPDGKRMAPLAEQVTHKTYVMEKNSLGIESMSFAFDGKNCVVTLKDERGEHQVPCGLGRWARGTADLDIQPLYLATTMPRVEQKVAGSGAWTDENTFEMFWRFIETAHYESVTCHFDGDEVKVEFLKSAAILSSSRKDERPALIGKAK